MALLIYERKYKDNDVINNFMNFYYAINMSHLASDLLNKGLSPKQITDAIAIAIKIANSSGIDAQKHFMPVYSGINQEIIQDCKLSHLGYGLVLMNADPSLTVVGKFQIDVLREFIKARS